MVIYTAMSQFTSEAEQDGFVSLVGALFAVPFILFTMAGGYCAVHYSKRTMAMRIKGTKADDSRIASALAAW